MHTYLWLGKGNIKFSFHQNLICFNSDKILQTLKRTGETSNRICKKWIKWQYYWAITYKVFWNMPLLYWVISFLCCCFKSHAQISNIPSLQFLFALCFRQTKALFNRDKALDHISWLAPYSISFAMFFKNRHIVETVIKYLL